MLQSVQYHSYHINLIQKLSENDYRLRIQICRWAFDAVEQNSDFFWNICFSDKTTFYSNDSLNRHNSHYWSPVNPHLNQHWNLHVWIGICNGQIISPHFFEHTINGPIYLNFLQNYLPIYCILRNFHWMSARSFGFSITLKMFGFF